MGTITSAGDESETMSMQKSKKFNPHNTESPYGIGTHANTFNSADFFRNVGTTFPGHRKSNS